MKFTLSVLLLLAAGWFSENQAGPPGSVTRTFYVTGVECGACVYLVQLSASERKGVVKADMEQTADSYANVTFDPRLVSEHQIAQAIREAMPVHGARYLARLKLRVGQYAKHAAAVALLFERWRDLVRCEVLDQSKGELMVHFLPLETASTQSGAVGWSAAKLQAALQANLPAGVTVEFVEEKPSAF
jgi:copper chaperone CopZ